MNVTSTGQRPRRRLPALPCLPALAAALALAGCALGPVTPLAPDTAARLPPVRFLLTFDDGPDTGPYGGTPLILRQLADNPLAPGIKAIFFVQTEHPRRGGGPEGRAQMRETCAQGQLMAVHSGMKAGHVPHTRLAPDVLAASLRRGQGDIAAQCGQALAVVRPPNWAYSPATQAVYAQVGLGMLMADANARDGKFYGWTISLRRRPHMRHELEQVGRAMAAHRLPAVDGVTPVIVAFHDPNGFTASRMTEYLQILVETARDNGLPLADPPFYTDTQAAGRAALARAAAGVYARDHWP
ncbi:polysaccharide deacetylase family protein [Cupriavidus sp. SZY C1]|uniref:polysaccharide deacetylase family protein n=1 Tax=Cupriavidus sp. SZY C1 TaxID=3055037 RepID=UPI0028B6932C|nr:polysaccharide deacetylase family protein [Cupriavidus sp. SZY C1]MDT6963771.1 polysaccharide deacetylase family protein [Cupriavidus sp. SZY C1]